MLTPPLLLLILLQMTFINKALRSPIEAVRYGLKLG